MEFFLYRFIFTVFQTNLDKNILLFHNEMEEVFVLILVLIPQVNPKRTNRPGISSTNRGFPRSRARGRGGSRGYYGGYRPTRRPRFVTSTEVLCDKLMCLSLLAIRYYNYVVGGRNCYQFKGPVRNRQEIVTYFIEKLMF